MNRCRSQHEGCGGRISQAVSPPIGDNLAGWSGRCALACWSSTTRVSEAIRRILGAEADVMVENNPVAGLEHLRSGARYDVVVCDLAMPVLSGPALHAALADTHHDLASRFVFITGSFSQMPDLPNPCIGKPFQAELLRRVVRDVAASSRRRTGS